MITDNEKTSEDNKDGGKSASSEVVESTEKKDERSDSSVAMDTDKAPGTPTQDEPMDTGNRGQNLQNLLEISVNLKRNFLGSGGMGIGV